MLVIISLCEESSDARNFLVASHKTYLTITKAEDSYNGAVTTEYLMCLNSFLKHPFTYHEQFVRIVKSLCLALCNQSDQLSRQDVATVVKGLTSAVKSKQKWIMDLIEENCQYDLLEKVLTILRMCVQSASGTPTQKEQLR